MRVARFTELFRKAATVEELFSLMREALRDLGIEQTIIGLMTATALSGLPDSDLLLNDLDKQENHPHRLEYKSHDPSQSTTVAGRSTVHEAPGTRGAEIKKKEANRVRIRVPAGRSPGIITAVILQSDSDIVLDDHSLNHISQLVWEFHQVCGLLEKQNGNDGDIRLSAREQEVLQWCAQGKSRDNIAGTLGISRNTVDYHLRNIYRKLNTGNVTVAVVKALQDGLIQI